MIEISKTWVGGIEGAIRGMRNPYESHEKSDSGFQKTWNTDALRGEEITTKFAIGEEDMKLCKKLIKAGSEHRKFLRMIHVQADVLAPRYWWQEARTYKYLRANPDDLEMNSSSTMHLITKRHLHLSDFSFDDAYVSAMNNDIIEEINRRIDNYNLSKAPDRREVWLRTIKQLLPEGFNQMATIDTNYECLLSIYHQRENHRLTEWRKFCNWIKSLPYMEEFLEAIK